jgi:hypothetical protein
MAVQSRKRGYTSDAEARERTQRGALASQKRAFGELVHPPRVLAKRQVRLTLDRAEKGTDGVGGALPVRVQIESRPVGPRMASENDRPLEIDLGAEGCTGRGEQILEDPTHRENGRAGVDVEAGDARRSRLAARGRRSLDHQDSAAGYAEIDGRSEPTYTGTNDDDLGRTGGHALDPYTRRDPRRQLEV